MANGRQKAEEGLLRFKSWVASRSVEDYQKLILRGKLSRLAMAKECGFARSVFSQNPRVLLELTQLETRLREAGVLPPADSPTSEAAPSMSAKSAPTAPVTPEAQGRLSRLERENALLRAENATLKATLSKHTLLSEALSLSGRLPR